MGLAKQWLAHHVLAHFFRLITESEESPFP